MPRRAPTPPSVTATEFARNFARYKDEAIDKKVINVTSHGRVIGAFLSATEFARYKEMKQRDRRVIIVDEMDDETLAMIENAQYGVAPK